MEERNRVLSGFTVRYGGWIAGWFRGGSGG